MKLKIRERQKISDLYRSISDFKNDYQPRTNIVNNDKGGLVTDSHSILEGGGTISLSRYMGLVKLGRHK
jgi:hypothetical protein